MPIPSARLKVFEKTRVDIAIEEFAQIEQPTRADLNKVIVQADLNDKLSQYRAEAARMDDESRETELHKPSTLAKFMASHGDPNPSPPYCDCHAMVSGAHRDAAPMRAVMAWCMMRIDDPRNGCWLPRHYDVVHRMPRWLSNAVPHQGLHNARYYDWLQSHINFESIKGLDDLIKALHFVRYMLQAGLLRPDAWPAKK